MSRPDDDRPLFNRREALQAALAASAALAVSPAQARPAASGLDFTKALGDRFTVALVADPQVEGPDTRSAVAVTSARKMARIVAELNAMERPPAFVLWNGDLVNNANPRQIDNFLDLAKPLTMPQMAVHGNHDGRPPYAEFKAIQETLNGTEGVWFGFDAGAWHVVTIPTNIPPNDEALIDEVLGWLDADLEAHRDRPTLALIHYHLMPAGLSQLEWYTYPKPIKKRLLEILTRRGNVKYVVSGHCHNGIETSLKTAWNYKGTNFLIAPTCTASRNFGEELPPFESGMDHGDGDTGGGYYLLLDFDGADLTIRGRLVGVGSDQFFPKAFRPYRDEEPLWLKDLVDDPPAPAFRNGSFAAGLDGWAHAWRYMADPEPGFRIEPGPAPAGADGGPAPAANALRLVVRDRGEPWAEDEVLEVYQYVRRPDGPAPVVSAGFLMEGATPGGGAYLRVCGFRGPELAWLMLVDWGDGDRAASHRIASNAIYTATGAPGPAFGLIQMGERKRAMFWRPTAAPGRWHRLTLNLAALYDGAHGRAGAFAETATDGLLIAAGVWCHEQRGSHAACRFAAIALEAGAPGAPSTFDGTPLAADASAFHTDIGLTQLQNSERDRVRPRRG
jgi:hypothetical protein